MVLNLAHYSLNPYAIPTFLTAAAVFFLGVAVLVRGQGSTVSVLFFSVTLTIGLWLFAFSWMYCATDERTALWWARAAYLGVPLIPASIYHFTVAVLRLYPRWRGFVWIGWALGVYFSAAIISTDALIEGVQRYWWGYYPRYGWLSAPYLTYFFGMMVAGLRLYWVEYRRATPDTVHRRLVHAFLVAFSVVYLASFDYLAKYGIPLYPFGYLPVLGFVLLSARAIWRYRLVDLTPNFAAKQILKTIADALLVLDDAGIIRAANAAAARLLGRSVVELIGLPLASVHAGLLPEDVVGSLMQAGGIQRYELSVTGGDQPWPNLEVSASALRDRAGRSVGIVWVAKDITARKRGERRLAAQYAVAHALAESTTVDEAAPQIIQAICETMDWDLGAIWYVDQDSKVLRRSKSWRVPSQAFPQFEAVSERTAFVLGIGLPGRVWASGLPAWIPDVGQDTNFPRAPFASAEGLHGAFGFPIRIDDKVIGVMEFFSREIRQPDHDLLQMLNATGSQFGQFIQRKRMEEALRVSESRFSRLSQSNIIGITVSHLDGRLLEANDAALQMIGYTREELQAGAIRWDQLTPPEWRHLDARATEQLKLFGFASPWETECLRKDRDRVPILIGVTLLEGTENKCLSFILDITTRKRAEQELRAFNETLEQRVAERSAAAEQRAQELARTNAELDVVMTELRAANARLQELSLLDPLTELLNRRGLQQALSQESQLTRRDGSSLLALLVDLDDFKQVNDTLGYAVGDVVVKEIARKLKACLRATDHVARIGGDEFMILLSNTRPAEGIRVAEKVRLGISGEPIWVSTGETVEVTASLGLIEVSADTPSLDELVSEAHLALYRSKRAGKNQVFYGRRGTTHSRGEGSVLVNVLTSMRRGDRLRAVMQPIFRLEDLHPVGYEMLSRLDLETFEMPDDFFRVCLEANMLTLMDHQCFKTCVAAAAHLPGDVRRHLNLFPSTIINIAVQDLLSAFPNGYRHGAYCIEISEQQIIGESSYLSKPIEALKRAGVLIAVDDVGFGRSSLESLIFLEPQIIKIDKRCVHGVARDASRARSLKRLLQVAKALRTDVVAEGIEVREDLLELKRLGVMYGQGFLLGCPVEPRTLGNGHGADVLHALRHGDVQ